MDIALVDQFETELQRMVGQVCWSAQVSGVGSLLSLNIGQKIRREQPMVYPDFKITGEERFFRGEFILYIEDCPWRIEDPERVAATWLDDNAPGGPIDAHTRRFIDQPVKQVALARPGLDLAITFGNNLTLRIFPDQNDADEGDNYSLAVADKTYVVTAYSILYLDD